MSWLEFRRCAAGLLLTGAVLVGCAQEGAGSMDPSTSSSDSSTSPSAGGSPQLSRPPSLPVSTPTSPKAGQATVTGTVVAGVERGCMLIGGGGQTFLLVGGDRALIVAGAHLTVTGRIDPTMMTTCQQGTPLVVDTVTPA